MWQKPERESCRKQVLLALLLSGRYMTHSSVSLWGGSVTLGKAEQDKSLQ